MRTNDHWLDCLPCARCAAQGRDGVTATRIRPHDGTTWSGAFVCEACYDALEADNENTPLHYDIM
jgi:hypothetical protein